MTDNLDDLDYLDGNAAAGPLSEFFAIDVVSARGRCASCGRIDALATARLYPNSHGLLLRCPGCAEILMRLVDTGDSVCLDLHGLSFIELRRG
ncbi:MULTISPECIES: DUF6510 family protein [Cryobacterium]|uniref:Uncharacterized protein n=1 Tax=Cryobacterium zongtaii TaxID=1259217 RepID=A0A2S3ZA98_9MICO|nr:MULTISPECIES: DUF6510 family protein [Cryobacterium]ASD22716.1 hypothetical protein B7495_12025 [Cryobacterium sp. LW097]POH62470.1 hypothetical protein C3B61_16595 [Cryobacterium zongtaii]POH66233.1 hypothetical protein C3B60_10590 [Cryobacterium zongtaii]TFC46901.1 hypothetical protein E3O57_06725 [Cryobacterium sp. TMN-39-2]TFC50011.1 hypothetical protein E3O68_18780 [Cryobacterium sp. TMB3-1-2]